MFTYPHNLIGMLSTHACTIVSNAFRFRGAWNGLVRRSIDTLVTAPMRLYKAIMARWMIGLSEYQGRWRNVQVWMRKHVQLNVNTRNRPVTWQFYDSMSSRWSSIQLPSFFRLLWIVTTTVRNTRQTLFIEPPHTVSSMTNPQIATEPPCSITYSQPWEYFSAPIH